jgi:hypothetical protein
MRGHGRHGFNDAFAAPLQPLQRLGALNFSLAS